jgi:uncharacterized NAD(P)/FAD-binding protein YdhS
MQSRFDLAIIGGGAAGTLAALQCLRQARAPLRIALFETAPRLGEGVAYSTTRPEHLLNVPTGRMSALPDRPDDFLDWLAARSGHDDIAREALARGFAPRREYAHYLRDRLQQARGASAATLEVLPARIDTLQRDGDGWTLHWTGGQAGARRVLLAVGNAARPLPARGASGLARPRLLDAWDYAGIAAIAADAEVCVVGTGLSMVDAVMTLAANGHRGRIHLLSRHALLPLAHSPGHQVDETLQVEALHPLGVRARLHRLRRQVRDAASCGLPWQAVMESLRPHVQSLWRSLPTAEQRRFLRHAVRYWDIHRHRIAPSVQAVIGNLLDSGQLRLHAARLDMAVAGQRCVQLTAHTRGRRTLALDVDHVVNATGVEMRVQAMRNPLLEQLLGDGHARPGAHGIGLASDAQGRLLDAQGHAQDDLRVAGSLRIGEAWESIAVPELRVQAQVIACDWLSSQPRPVAS